MNDDAIMKRAKEYVAIELWFVGSGYPPSYWQDWQEKAAAEGAPLDAIDWNAEARKWLRVRDLRAGHPFRAVVARKAPHLLLLNETQEGEGTT